MSEQTNLSVLLDGIEERANKARKLTDLDRFNNDAHDALAETPLLVKALRELWDEYGTISFEAARYNRTKLHLTAILQASSEPKKN